MVPAADYGFGGGLRFRPRITAAAVDYGSGRGKKFPLDEPPPLCYTGLVGRGQSEIVSRAVLYLPVLRFSGDAAYAGQRRFALRAAATHTHLEGNP